MPISTMCGREGFLEDSSAARSRFWRVGQANATNRAAVNQILRITLVMNRGPFAWYFLGPVGQSSPLAPREDYFVGRPRTSSPFLPQEPLTASPPRGRVGPCGPSFHLVLNGRSIARGKRRSRHFLPCAVSQAGVRRALLGERGGEGCHVEESSRRRPFLDCSSHPALR